MKIIKKGIAFLIILMMLITQIGVSSVLAFNNTITIKRSEGAAKPGGIYFGQQYKYDISNNNTAVFCAEYYRSLNDGTCRKVTAKSDNWSVPTRAGIAKIIDKARFDNLDPNSQITNEQLQKNLQITLAINQFLLDIGEGSNYNKIPLNLDPPIYKMPSEFLDNTFKEYVTYAKAEYNRVNEKQPEINATIKDNATNTIIYNPTNPSENLERIIVVTSENIEGSSLDIKVSRGGKSIPAGMSLDVYISNDPNSFPESPSVTFNNTQGGIQTLTADNATTHYIKFKFNIQQGANLGEITLNPYVYATQNMTYRVAQKYDCGDSKQTLTPNLTEEVKLSDYTSKTIVFSTVDVPDYPKLKIVKKDTNNNNVTSSKATFKIEKKVVDINNSTIVEYISKRTDTNGEIIYDEIEDGEYCVTETKSPSGYILNTAKPCFTVTMNSTANSNTINVVEIPDTNNSNNYTFGYDEQNKLIVITMKDEVNKIKLGKKVYNSATQTYDYKAGATLKLTSERNSEAEPIVHHGETLQWTTTEENLTKEITGLPAGTYYLYEVTPPDGYILKTVPVKITIDGTEVEEEEYYIKNGKTKVRIRKVDENAQQLRGAQLQIKEESSNQIVVQPFSTEGEDVLIEGVLKINTNYILEEVNPPAGYTKADPIKFYLDNGGNVIILEGDIYNELTVTIDNNTVKVAKTVNNTNIANAKIQLLKDGNVVKLKKEGNTLTPDENGDEYWLTTEEESTITGLSAGNYFVHEIETTSGYALNDKDIEFKVLDDGTIKLIDRMPEYSIFIVNNLQNEIQISKTDKDGKALKDAHLQLLDSNNKVVKLKSDGNNGLIPAKSTDKDAQEYWVTTEEAQIIRKLPEGKYKVKEIKAPNGYVLSDEILEFEINKKGQMIVNKKQQKSNTLIMANEETKVYISKQDITNKEELPGATLVIKDENGNEIEKWVSTNEPHLIEGLGEGTYTLTEITAPDGYSLNEETITFKIDANGVLSGDTLMFNTPIADVPSTFSAQSLLFIAIGVVLVGSGVGLYIYGIKKKNEI